MFKYFEVRFPCIRVIKKTAEGRFPCIPVIRKKAALRFPRIRVVKNTACTMYRARHVSTTSRTLQILKIQIQKNKPIE